MRKYFIKFLRVIIWPIIFIIGQFLISLGFIYSFYLKNFNSYNINEIINSSEYKEQLSNYINNNTLFIVLVMLIILLPPFYLAYKKVKPKKVEFKLNDILPLIIILISFSIFYNIVIYLLNSKLNFSNYSTSSTIPIYIQIISSGIVGPILEELLYRGIVFYKLKSFNSINKSLLITSILFAFTHSNLINAVYAFIIGIILNKIVIKTENIKLSIVLHGIINTIVIFLVVLLKNNIYFVNIILLLLSFVILTYYVYQNLKSIYYKK